VGKRKGRPRQANRQRYENGRAKAQPAISEETLKARARMAGVSVDKAKDHRCGTVLGRLFLKGRVTERQFDAGTRFAKLHTAWANLTDCPAGTARAMTLPYKTDVEPDPLTGGEYDAMSFYREMRDEDRWPDIRDAYDDTLQSIHALPGGRYVHAMLLKACVFDDEVNAAEIYAMRRGLDELVMLYRVPVAA
jgi:hypothetical protein